MAQGVNSSSPPKSNSSTTEREFNGVNRVEGSLADGGGGNGCKKVGNSVGE